MKAMVTLRSMELKSKDGEKMLKKTSLMKRELDGVDDCDLGLYNASIRQESASFKRRKSEMLMCQPTVSSIKLTINGNNFVAEGKVDGSIYSPQPINVSCPRSLGELDAAATKLQKFYKSYRTRRNLADCAVVLEELWWKALDFAALRHSSLTFFDADKSETAVSRWARAGTRAAKVGKGLLKDKMAQKLALRHWLEAIDPRHRYGHNLHLYYRVWFGSESSQPFFYWLDVGDGKEVNLEKCQRSNLQRECIKYLGPKERETYEVNVENGKLVYKQSRDLVDSSEGSKWIFVLSTSRKLYVGEKKKGEFQHSSFLAGGATISSGRLVAHSGVLKAIWPNSGHYRPTQENFMELCRFLEEKDVELTNVLKTPIDDDIPPVEMNKEVKSGRESAKMVNTPEDGRSRRKWCSGAGARINCVREYPEELQFKALEQVNLSPRSGPIPFPRPNQQILSPRIASMGMHANYA